jgi:hypothetical protein
MRMRDLFQNFFFTVRYIELSAAKFLWNVSSNLIHIRRKIKNKHATLNFLSLFRHCFTLSMYFCYNFHTAHLNELIFSDILGKIETHLRTKERTF